jgi:broad-specificity NMP kinase
MGDFMLKELIIINGTMGAGKTTICNELSKRLDHSVWLDGDWCWMMNPWIFSEENKKMVIENIVFLLRNYLKNSMYRYVIFGWVIHEKEILDVILKQVSDLKFEMLWFTLICSRNTLEQRLKNRGENTNTIENSIGRLAKYDNMASIKINTDHDLETNIRIIQKYLTNKE